VHIDRFGPNKR